MFYSGTQGQMFIDGVKAAKVRSWSFNSSLTLLATTTLGDTDKTSVPGIRTNTGNCSIFYYAPADGLVGENSCSTLIRKLLKQKATGGGSGQAGEAEKVRLRLTITESASSTGVKHIEGDAYLKSVAMSCAVGEVFSAEVSFECDGAWSEVAL